MSGAEFTCGPLLEECRCRVRGAVALSPAGMLLRHEASVRRAQFRSAGIVQPVVTDNMLGRQATAQASARALAAAASLDDLADATLRRIGRAA